MKYLQSLRDGLDALIREKDAFLLGEDIQDPYGGAFGATKGLSSKHPRNVLAMPMSEQGFTGLGVGMAVQGCCVIVEIMFGDFITLIADQMINHAAKFHDMYGMELHLVVRCPSGGYRGYGATHSQSLERMFLGVPGMQVVAPSVAHDPGRLLGRAAESGMPTLFVENKLDYARGLLGAQGSFWRKETMGAEFPAMRIFLRDSAPDITILTYGGMVPMAMEAMRHFLYEEEVSVEVIVPSLLSDLTGIAHMVRGKGVVVLEEGVSVFGWGAEACCLLAEDGVHSRKVGAKRMAIPAAGPAEENVLPVWRDLAAAVRKEMDFLGIDH